MLQDYLGGTDQETTTTLVQENGWSLKQEGGVAVVAIRNQEANIRPKKILAKIEFESEWSCGCGHVTVEPLCNGSVAI